MYLLSSSKQFLKNLIIYSQRIISYFRKKGNKLFLHENHLFT